MNFTGTEADIADEQILAELDARFGLSGPCKIFLRDGQPASTVEPIRYIHTPDSPLQRAGPVNRGIKKAAQASMRAKHEAKTGRYTKLRKLLLDGMPIAEAARLCGVPDGTSRNLRLAWGIETPCTRCGGNRHRGNCHASSPAAGKLAR